MAKAEVEPPDLKWATLVFFLSLGIFPLGFYSVYASEQYPLNPSVWLHWGHGSTLCSFSMGKALILFYSQARLRVVIGAGRLSPTESAASGPTALVFVWGEEPVGPGRNLFPVERIKDCTPAQVKPRRPDLQVMGEPPGVPYGHSSRALKGCPQYGLWVFLA